MSNGPLFGVNLSDKDLVERVVARDPAALSVLYDRYAHSIYTLAAHLLGAPDAEEIVQDVFLRLWRRAERFDPERGQFSAWLMTVARYRIIDELRRRGKLQQVRSTEEVERIFAGLIDPRENVEEVARRREEGQSLHRALFSLPLSSAGYSSWHTLAD